MEGAPGRAHLVVTTSGSDFSYHNTSSGRLIVIGSPPPELLRKPRYGALHITAKTPRDDPTEYINHQHGCLGMGWNATRTSSVHENPPDTEACATSTCCTLRRSAPPSTSSSYKHKPALQTSSMAYAIATEQILSQLRGRGPRGRDSSGRLRRILWRSAPPYPSPFHEHKPALQTGAMDYSRMNM